MGYKFIHNSPTSSRGVGILLKKSLLDNLNILNTVRDREGNYILIDVEYRNERYTFGSIYGANTNEGIHMYDSLEADIKGLKNKKIIIGGGFQCHL